jgi:competence protein ComEC
MAAPALREERPRAPVGEVLGPLAPLVLVGMVAGRIAAISVSRGPLRHHVLVGLLIAAALALVATLLLEQAGAPLAASGMLLVAGILVVGGGVVVRVATSAMGLLPDVAARGGVVVLEGRVAAEPRSGDRGWQTIVRVHGVDGTRTRERAAVVLPTALPLGTPVRMSVTARPLPDGGYGRWLVQQHATVLLDERETIVIGGPGRFSSASEHVRDRIRRAATKHLPEDVGGLLTGFVTGDTRLLPESDVVAMQATGLSHLTAVSGSNTAVLLAGVAGLLALARVPARVRWLVLGLTVPWFAFVTRLEPSVLRAGAMALLVIAAAVRGVARDPRHLLAGAVLLLILIDPMLTWSLGLMLSAGATLGVLVVAPELVRVFERHLPRRVAQLLAITLGAQSAVTPVLLAGFGTLELVSVPANMVAVPLAAVGATIAFVASAVALVHLPTAGSLFVLGGPAASGVLAVARTLDEVGGAVVLPDTPLARPSAFLMTLGLLLGWALRRALRSPGRPPRTRR